MVSMLWGVESRGYEVDLDSSTILYSLLSADLQKDWHMVWFLIVLIHIY